MMNNLEPWEKIIKECKAGSKTYEALREFLSTTGQEAYQKVGDDSTRLEGLRNESKSYETHIESQRTRLAQIEQSYQENTVRNESLIIKNRELEAQNKRLEIQNAELINKGVDDEVIGRILNFDHETREELVDRITTLESYAKFREEFK